MQSRIKMSQKRTRQVCDDVWQTILKAMCDNLATTVIVLNDEFGFGKERIRRFIEATVNKNRKISEWQDEGIADVKIREIIESIGLKYEEIYFEDKQDFKDFLHESRKRKEHKNKVGFADAMKAQQHLQTMKDLLNQK